MKKPGTAEKLFIKLNNMKCDEKNLHWKTILLEKITFFPEISTLSKKRCHEKSFIKKDDKEKN